MDDALGHGVARGGLGAEEEGMGIEIHVGIIPQLLVEIDNVHGVEQLDVYKRQPDSL